MAAEQPTKSFEDILISQEGAVVTIAINRPEVMNAVRPQTVDELIRAIDEAGWDSDVAAIVLTGVGLHFCTGGDQSEHQGQYKGRGSIGMAIEALQSVIRDVPKPVVARVRGYSIGAGNVLATLCDLTISGDAAVFGQVGPRVGSVDPGFGTAYLARVVGEKKAREMWYLCRKYDAHQALEMGLVNVVVPDDELDQEVSRWCEEISGHSPTAMAIAKRSFNADTEGIRAVSALGMQTLSLFYETEESREGVRAFLEKRTPNFRRT